MAKMMSSAIMDGSLYDDLNDFQKPRVRGMYPVELKVKQENSLLSVLPDSRAFPLTTSDVDSLFPIGCALTTTTASTPNRFLRNSAPVTAEQEMYAQGFLDALDQLHQRHNKNGLLDTPVLDRNGYCATHVSHPDFTHSNPLSLASVAPTYVTASMDTIPDFSNTQGAQSTFHVSTSTSGHDAYAFGGMMPFVQQPAQPHPLDTYGSYGVLPTNPMGSNSSIHSDDTYRQVNPDLLRELQAVVPADIRTQEHMKVERKKARNRIAASKCRLRRLQRESELSTKVKALKDHNRELRDQLNELKDQLSDLKTTVNRHAKGGCRIGEKAFVAVTAS